ncbi:MAG: aromatic ring-hydroxylating dioxygenase subunit alpha, partial [Proteobacteria bacterium]|nr:aromatic ring-hydroxylating dioxygenase subunit alpha [Pseudomonadota bacterium]
EKLAGAHRDLEKATTLPAGAFTSPAVYSAEVERIFEREWLCAGRADQIPEPGDYFALDLLGEKLVVVRGRDGEIRVLSRVCRHRAAELVRGAGNTRSFQCPYHAWTYRLDGALVGAPMMDGAEGFDRQTCRLPELRSELWEGWIFVNFDADAAPLGPRLEPLSKLLAPYAMADMVAVETATFDSPFNWKVLVDNFMEAYHHIATHRDTLEPVFPARRSHTPDNEGPYSVLFMPDRADAEIPFAGLPRASRLDTDQERWLVAAVVYPFHLFAPSAESLAWYQLLPHGHDRFTLRIYTCFAREALDDPAHAEAVEGIQAFTKIVHHQDIEACEAVWSGLGSRCFDTGRLCPLEKTIWQFNQWWVERMTGAR